MSFNEIEMIQFTWMIHRAGKSMFHDDPESSWKKLFSTNSKTFVRNGHNFPIKIFFSTRIFEATPVLMTLPSSFGRPIFSLTVFRAVGPLLASSTKFGGDSAEIQTESAVPVALSIILNEFKVNLKALK